MPAGWQNLVSNTCFKGYEVFLVDKVRENLDITLSGRERGHPVTEDAYENAGRLMDEYKPDVVLCLLPAAMNSRIARECIQRSIDMTAASYAKEEIRNLSEEAEAKGVLFLLRWGSTLGSTTCRLRGRSKRSMMKKEK